eukprot:TRINITY_DN5738_c0_g1::TRINITY_DN5738_c0_g1_i1::g.14556::m.14556 TRINITY_DN5738_c0_g1::TRINITY_DN5738_c0_g1_i1::g.14556  ORF type:complete len:550 (+),score=31.38,sp/P32348/TBG_USTVI/28.21/2e-26,Tubulin/PF00091.20/1.1e-42 TRINITY_DN5738_c0_g1_i1:236-1885(+)
MSTLYISVGQAGCQLGGEFWSIVASESTAAKSSFLDPQGKARCVFIDSEPKVVRSILRDGKGINGVPLRDIIRESNLVYDQPGRGNNWAFGYEGCKMSVADEIDTSMTEGGTLDENASLFARAMARIRHEVERMEWLGGIVVMHSISGGTGSGLGSRIIEGLRYLYPRTYILSACVGPYRHSDTILAPYNSVLSLAWLQRYTDGIVLLQNEDILKSLSSQAHIGPSPTKSGTGPTRKVSVGLMNSYMASCLSGLTFPIVTEEGAREFELADFVTSVCPMPSHKFIEPRCFPFLAGKKTMAAEHATWSHMATSLSSFVPRFDHGSSLPMTHSVLTSFSSSSILSSTVLNTFGSTTSGTSGTSGTSTAGSTAGGVAQESSGGGVSGMGSGVSLGMGSGSSSSSGLSGSGASRPIHSAMLYSVVRGESPDRFFAAQSAQMKKTLSQTYNPVGWNPFPWDWVVSSAQAFPTHKIPRMLTVAANRTNTSHFVEHVLHKAELMFEAKAYVHWYARYGVSAEILEDCFDILHDVVNDYLKWMPEHNNVHQPFGRTL